MSDPLGRKCNDCDDDDDEEALVIVEEDWSSFCPDTSNGFASYTTKHIVLQAYDDGGGSIPLTVDLELKCLEELTPMAMMKLVNGDADGTGERLWPGAWFFVKALLQENANNNSLLKLFSSKRVLELGSGTGFASLALYKLLKVTNQPLPLHMLLTDNNQHALQLMEWNCQTNLSDDDDRTFVRVEPLDWNDDYKEVHSFDTIFATDVVYDVNVLRPLFRTVSQTIHQNGTFCLSHIPRASIMDGLASRDVLEQLMDQEASRFQLERIQTIRTLSPATPVGDHHDDTTVVDAALLLYARKCLSASK